MLSSYFSVPKRLEGYAERALTIYTVRLEFEGLWTVRQDFAYFPELPGIAGHEHCAGGEG
jgi:hypothetical protein